MCCLDMDKELWLQMLTTYVENLVLDVDDSVSLLMTLSLPLDISLTPHVVADDKELAS